MLRYPFVKLAPGVAVKLKIGRRPPGFFALDPKWRPPADFNFTLKFIENDALHISPVLADFNFMLKFRKMGVAPLPCGFNSG